MNCRYGGLQELNYTIAAAVEEEVSGIYYEFIVDPPLPFQPDDILGVFQPSQQNSTEVTCMKSLKKTVNPTAPTA